MEVAINRGAEGKTGRYFVPNISEERAVELAARFISESFLFSVSNKPVTCTVLHGALPRYLDHPASSAVPPAEIDGSTCGCLPQVGVGVIFLEYRRTERNAFDKKRKEEEFRQHLDDGMHRDREVGCKLSYTLQH
jgi:hypothetical protein